MKARILISVLLVGIIGVLLLGKGISGMAVVSQSCCFGPTCASGNLCDAAEPPEGSTGSHFDFLFGAVLLIVGIYSTALLFARSDP